MGDIRKASLSQEKLWQERALMMVLDKHEELHGPIPYEQLDAFIDKNCAEIYDTFCHLMDEAGLE